MIDSETDMIVPQRSGIRTFGDDDSVAYRWALFSKPEAEDWLNWSVLTNGEEGADLANALTGWHYQDNGAGQFFANVPMVKVNRTKILVIQRIGYNI
jgi:hypothetical protein